MAENPIVKALEWGCHWSATQAAHTPDSGCKFCLAHPIAEVQARVVEAARGAESGSHWCESCACSHGDIAGLREAIDDLFCALDQLNKSNG